MDNTYEALSVIGKYCSMYIDRVFADTDINSSHQSIIVAACNNPCLTQDALRKIVHVSPSNITRAIDHLIENGYIEKKRCHEDRRTYCLYPTGKAFRARQKIRRAEVEWVKVLTQSMTEEQARSFEELLLVAKDNAVNNIDSKKK